MIQIRSQGCIALNSSFTFPVGIPSIWMEPRQLSIPNDKLENWLLDSGSLTERLQAQCEHFHLALLGQRQEEPTLEEFQQVSCPQQVREIQDWQVREVLLFGDGKPWVFARSIIPQRLCENDFINLNTKPLGQLLFNDKRFVRMPIEVTRMQDSDVFLQQLQLAPSAPLWGRRSVFCFDDLKMLVSEVFLPGSPAYSAGN